MRKVRAILLAGILWAGPAYSSAAGQTPAAFRVDTVGSVLVTKNLVTRPYSAPGAVRPNEVFRIGSVSGEAETFFVGPLMSVSNGPNGQLWVLDQLAYVVRVFDRDGSFLREFGRAGRGPGEFESPSALAWSPDGRLWVPEPFGGRYSVFDSLGTFEKTVPRPFLGGVNRRVYPAAFGADGLLLDHASDREGAVIIRVDSTGTVLESFPPMLYGPNPLAGTLTVGRDPEWIDAIRRFRPSLRWTLAPDGTLWMARTNSLRLINRTLEGDTLRIIETLHRPPVFSQAERDVVRRVSRMYESITLSPMVIQSLHASDDGLLFVQIAGEMGESGREIDVFGQEGQYLGSFELELPIQPLSQSHFVGGYFSYVGIGPFDVPIVVRTRVGG